MEPDGEDTGFTSLVSLVDISIIISGYSEHKMPIENDIIPAVCTGSFIISCMVVKEIIIFLTYLVYKPSIIFFYIPRGKKCQVILFIIFLIDLWMP